MQHLIVANTVQNNFYIKIKKKYKKHILKKFQF